MIPGYVRERTWVRSFERLRRGDINLSSFTIERHNGRTRFLLQQYSCVPWGLLALHHGRGVVKGERGCGRKGPTNIECSVADCIRLRLHNSELYQSYTKFMIMHCNQHSYIRSRPLPNSVHQSNGPKSRMRLPID